MGKCGHGDTWPQHEDKGTWEHMDMDGDSGTWGHWEMLALLR